MTLGQAAAFKGVPLEPFPHLSRWFEGVGARPAVIKGMNVPEAKRDPDKVIETARTMLVT